MKHPKLLLIILGLSFLSCNTTLEIDKYIKSKNALKVSLFDMRKDSANTSKSLYFSKDSEFYNEFLNVLSSNLDDWEKSIVSYAGDHILVIEKDALTFKYYIKNQLAVVTFKEKNNKSAQYVKNIEVNVFKKLIEFMSVSEPSIRAVHINTVKDTNYVNLQVENKDVSFLSTFPESPTPCYFSSNLSAKLKKGQLNDKEFNALTIKEHFIHTLYHPEWYRQSCSIFPLPRNIYQCIPARFKMIGEGYIISTRQREILLKHKDSVCQLLEDCIREKNVVNDNFKRIITYQDFYELIPALISTIEHQDKKDPYILTTFCLMMKNNFKQFQASEIFELLYSQDSTEEIDFRDRYLQNIPFTIDNYEKIIRLVKSYYLKRSELKNRFVSFPKAKYILGVQGHHTNPLRDTLLEFFTISRYEISNQEFSKFVNATHYQTTAERKKDAFVFEPGLDEFEWIQDSTANWKFPNGKSKGGIENKMDHPITCISYLDAQAYCSWANVRLPSIEEWEVASRGNSNHSKHFFGDSSILIYEHANIWHGKNHLKISDQEDYVTTSPISSFKANDVGMYDVYGNVFEFCSNIPKAFKAFPNVAATRGGSWWCSARACGFFNSIDIGRVKQAASFSNNGFRVVLF